MTSPAFYYPMIGILSPEACEEPGETGIRHFPDPKVLDVVWDGDLSARLGMLLVDIEGRAWRVTGVKKLGRSLNPLARYWRVAHGVVEEPPMTFEALKGLLLKTLKAQASAYDGLHPGYLRDVRRNILDARSLRDIVRTEAEVEALNAPDSVSSLEAVTGDGRGSRLEFIFSVGGLAVVGLLLVKLGVWLMDRPLPLVLMAPLAIGFAFAAAAVIRRRVHDVGLGAGWAYAAFVAAMTPSAVLDLLLPEDADFWIGWLIPALFFLFVALLATWPSQPRPNRFGRFPANRAGRLAAAAATADDQAS